MTPQLWRRCSPVPSGALASRLSSDDAIARPETTQADTARSVRIDPKFFMMTVEKVCSVKLAGV
jgi:hypothetical protein